MHKTRWASVITFVALLIAGGFYFGSCVYSLKKLGEAANAADGAAVLARTDVLRLRRSLAIQLVAAYQRRPDVEKRPNAVRQLLKYAGTGMADALIEHLLTPDRLSELLRTGKAEAAGDGPSIAMPAIADINALDAISRVRFVNPVSLAFRMNKAPGEDYFLVMHFENFAWKFAGLELPAAAADRMVAGLK